MATSIPTTQAMDAGLVRRSLCKHGQPHTGQKGQLLGVFLRTGVKQDSVTALRTAPLHTHSLFSDQLLLKAEEEVSRSEERRSAGNSHRKPSHYHPYASNDKPSHQPDQKSGVPAWKQIRDWQQSRKGCGKASTFTQKPAKGSKQCK